MEAFQVIPFWTDPLLAIPLWTGSFLATPLWTYTFKWTLPSYTLLNWTLPSYPQLNKTLPSYPLNRSLPSYTLLCRTYLSQTPRSRVILYPSLATPFWVKSLFANPSLLNQKKGQIWETQPNPLCSSSECSEKNTLPDKIKEYQTVGDLFN